LHKPMSQPMGAMWQPMTGPRGTFPLAEYDATCQQRIEPPVCRGVCPVNNCTAMSLPCQHATVSATSACATCHPYSGDTCHPLTGPIPVIHHITCHVSSPGAATSVVRPVQSACHMALYRLYSHPFFFSCLGFRTECDIFRIQSPFDEVNIWPESGR
jgi:hypothetical protein